MPSPIPMPPPISESTIASIKNWRMMFERFAPIALRIPISRVRSVTETSMMFMMPIPATTKATPPIAERPAATTLSELSKAVMNPAPF